VILSTDAICRMPEPTLFSALGLHEHFRIRCQNVAMLIKFRVKLVSKSESRMEISIHVRMDGNGWMDATIDE
jgi:hypothetical protein